MTVGSFSTDDGNGSQNVTLKMSSRFLRPPLNVNLGFFLRCSLAEAVEKCTKKRDARAKLLFCLISLLLFLTFSLPSPSSLLSNQRIWMRKTTILQKGAWKIHLY